MCRSSSTWQWRVTEHSWYSPDLYKKNYHNTHYSSYLINRWYVSESSFSFFLILRIFFFFFVMWSQVGMSLFIVCLTVTPFYNVAALGGTTFWKHCNFDLAFTISSFLKSLNLQVSWLAIFNSCLSYKSTRSTEPTSVTIWAKLLSYVCYN